MQVVNTLSTLMGRLKENNFDHVVQWFQSSRTPPLRTFSMFILSLQMFVLFDCKCPVKWTSHHRIFRHDSSSKRTNMFH